MVVLENNSHRQLLSVLKEQHQVAMGTPLTGKVSEYINLQYGRKAAFSNLVLSSWALALFFVELSKIILSLLGPTTEDAKQSLWSSANMGTVLLWSNRHQPTLSREKDRNTTTGTSS